MVTSIHAASAEDAVQSKGEFASLQEECYLSRQRTASVESVVTIQHQEYKVLATKVSFLGSENTAQQKKVETSSKTHAGIKGRARRDPGEMCYELEKTTRDCDVLRAKVGEIDRGLENLRDTTEANAVMITERESIVAFDAMAIDHLATLLMYHRLKCHRVNTENGES